MAADKNRLARGNSRRIDGKFELEFASNSFFYKIEHSTIKTQNNLEGIFFLVIEQVRSSSRHKIVLTHSFEQCLRQEQKNEDWREIWIIQKRRKLESNFFSTRVETKKSFFLHLEKSFFSGAISELRIRPRLRPTKAKAVINKPLVSQQAI